MEFEIRTEPMETLFVRHFRFHYVSNLCEMKQKRATGCFHIECSFARIGSFWAKSHAGIIHVIDAYEFEIEYFISFSPRFRNLFSSF